MYHLFIVFALMLVFQPASAAKNILVFGDSISAAYGMSPEQGWASLLAKKLTGSYSQYTLSNESISGETSAGGLARIDQALQTHKPVMVLLELGANDGLRGLSATALKNNLTEIINRCRNSGAKVLLLGMKIPPNYGKRYIDLFYNVYPQLADAMKLPLVPFMLADVALKPELMQADGLHPNSQAQPLIAELIWGYLQPLL